MMVAFNFLSNPMKLSAESISVLCVENKSLYREIINSFCINELEENNIIFSENYNPIDSKKYVCFIDDFFNLNFSSSFVKKLYDDINLFCNTEFQEDVAKLNQQLEFLFSNIVNEFDYDVTYSDEYSLPAIFKALDLKPNFKGNSLLESLLQYILIIKKYSKIKCFVLLNLHLYFSQQELAQFYKELQYNNIIILAIENNKNFERLYFEKIIVIDNDFCEIVDK